jgi:hypothetical protein
MPCSWLPRALGLLLAAAALQALGLAQAAAADTETRIFAVNVDGKKAGDYQMVIQRQDDGTVVFQARSDVRVTLLAIPVYTYSYQGREVWKAGALQHFQSTGKEKGKDFAIRADLDGSTIKVVANGQEGHVPADVWMTSCWQLPPARYRNADVQLLGCDTGVIIKSRCEYVGTEQIKVLGQVQNCTHYRVMKDAMHDIWYDAQERLVRDEWTSNGHKTVVEMTDLGH